MEINHKNYDLEESLKHGFIDQHTYQKSLYSPQLVLNIPKNKIDVLTELKHELVECNTFCFCIAFITKSGLAMIKSELSDFMDRQGHGKIIISPYLGFNDPEVMVDLLNLRNIEVRIAPEKMQLHSKYYLFEKNNQQSLILGSSNLTGGALKLNYESNVKLISANNGALINHTRDEFESIWAQSYILTHEIINDYRIKRQPNVVKSIKIILNEDNEADENVEATKAIQPNHMQESALAKLSELRRNNLKKAMVISATGTGKTYLAAFDAKQFKPRCLLFVVHREQVLHKALESYQAILKFADSEACVYKPNMNLEGKKFIFTTIQTLSKNENLSRFHSKFFDYILVDEVHRAGATTYRKVLNYFEPDFLLGMTATPERTDGQDIYELFDYNIAFEIRLQEAIENNLVCPFIYFGVTDIRVNGELIDGSDFSNLIAEQRVKHIIDKITYYGHDGEKVKGLIFCSRRQEAKELSEKFNQLSFRTRALNGDDSQEERDKVVKQLEAGELDYIFTVDIFNEGIDIPSINQVVMLRNTTSSIIFIQQLGRGLRKFNNKKFVTIIDFIGNYSSNYLIPIALFGNKSMDKDSYRCQMLEPNILSGLTTINFEKVAKEQIFKSITDTNLSSIKILKDSYVEMENRLGRTPYLKDFVIGNSIDPLVFFENSSFKNYKNVLNKFSNLELNLSKTEEDYLSFITFELLNGKRKHELLLLKMLIEKMQPISHDEWKNYLNSLNLSVDPLVLLSVQNVLSLRFLKSQEVTKFGNTPLADFDGNYYMLNNDVRSSLMSNQIYFTLFYDVIETGLLKSEKYHEILTIAEKYSRRDVLKLLNFLKDEPPLNIGGYKIDKHSNSCPIFITYHKSDDINDSIKYEDKLLNESTLRWFSKNKRTMDSPDVSSIINSSSNGLTLHLFIIKDDSEGGEFYYLGKIEYIQASGKEMIKAGDNVVEMLFKLVHPIEPNLYRYITSR